MVKLINKPTLIEAAGNKPKRIEEFIGRVNSADSAISIARMKSPPGWQEPAQTPEFTEYTFVIKGYVNIAHQGKIITVRENEIFVAEKGETIQYSTPQGAEYIAVCLPAFSPYTVHRE